MKGGNSDPVVKAAETKTVLLQFGYLRYGPTGMLNYFEPM